jgi:Ala-tRNA(Pro) deacylase
MPDAQTQTDPAIPPATPEDLFARFAELGIPVTTHDHAPVFTVEESRHLHDQLPGGHCKSLFLRNKKGRCWLVVCEEDTKIDLKALGTRLEAGRLSFGSAERLMQRLGVTPGSVTPFALINDREATIKVVLDQRMMRHELLNYHPLVNHRTTAIARDDLLRFVEACGHSTEIVDMAVLSDG